MILEAVYSHVKEFWDIVNYYDTDEWPWWVKEIVSALKEKREPVGLMQWKYNVWLMIVETEYELA